MQQSITERIIKDDTLYSRFKQLLKKRNYDAGNVLQEMGFEEEVKNNVLPQVQDFVEWHSREYLEKLEAKLKTEEGRSELWRLLGLQLQLPYCKS